MQQIHSTLPSQARPSLGGLRDVRLPGPASRIHLADKSNASSPDTYPIIVHSHLEWDWVWQRPQQFLSRFAKEHPVLFVEGPKIDPSADHSRLSLRPVEGHPNILVVQMWMPESRWPDGAWIDAERLNLLKRLLVGPLGKAFADPVQWFYDPMAVASFAGQMGERAIVYDCMDQLSQFRGAPAELVRRERELLAVADVVFAGGPKIHSAKAPLNSNCHSFGCGVDVAHFGKALDPETAVPSDVAGLPGPVFGYFGVVDERIDYDLLARLADACPHGSVVVVGPATKVDPAEFPQRGNLHWLGGRDYSQLPAYVKAFDVCLMPFAINEATEFINPTKALEYMATRTPIVSTAIEDVVLQFSDVVKIAASPDGFVQLALGAAANPDSDAALRGTRLAERNSWESIVEQMKAHIADVLDTKAAIRELAA
jgi:glycosyltransferase involved in cell wall biosynthesis